MNSEDQYRQSEHYKINTQMVTRIFMIMRAKLMMMMMIDDDDEYYAANDDAENYVATITTE